MSNDSLTRRVRATLTVEIEYDLDDRVSIDRLKKAVNKIADDAAAFGLLVPKEIGFETSLLSWASKASVVPPSAPVESAASGVAVGLAVSIGDGQTFIDASQGVRVVYRGLNVWDDEDDTDAPEKPADLVFTFTHEGVVTDLWIQPVEGEKECSHLEATDSSTIDEIVARLS